MSVKEAIRKAINDHKDELIVLGGDIWKNPELSFKEFNAHKLLTEYLEKKGFAVEKKYTGIETAFKATFGSGRPNVCVICEYDALPEIGHACGHNLIAEAGVAAGLGLKAALESGNGIQGRLTVLGTPAEESGGGKIKLIGNGAFDDVDVAMMVHPGPLNVLSAPWLASASYKVTYTGKASHASAFPWEGLNALDAAVIAYNSISVLRQQIKPDCRVHCIIKEGGVRANVIPERAVLQYGIRAPKRDEREKLAARVRLCFEAAKTATECKAVEIVQNSKPYDDVVSNQELGNRFKQNMPGVEWLTEGGDTAASTDMGNVSYKVPSIHPIFGIGNAFNHTVEFNEFANKPKAHEATLRFAEGLALTGLDVLTDPVLLDKIKSEFETSIKATGSPTKKSSGTTCMCINE